MIDAVVTFAFRIRHIYMVNQLTEEKVLLLAGPFLSGKMLILLGAAQEAGLVFHFLLPPKNPLDSIEGCLKILFLGCPDDPHIILSTTAATFTIKHCHKENWHISHFPAISHPQSNCVNGYMALKIWISENVAN